MSKRPASRRLPCRPLRAWAAGIGLLILAGGLSVAGGVRAAVILDQDDPDLIILNLPEAESETQPETPPNGGPQLKPETDPVTAPKAGAPGVPVTAPAAAPEPETTPASLPDPETTPASAPGPETTPVSLPEPRTTPAPAPGLETTPAVNPVSEPETERVTDWRPQPVPPTLDPADIELYQSAFKLAKRQKWARVRELAAKGKHPLPRKILMWYEMTQSGGNYSFSEIVEFTSRNPDWPLPNTLRNRAEQAIDESTPDDTILAWFADRSPRTTEGKIAYGRALINAGQADMGFTHLRDAWIYGRFSRSEERAFLGKYRKRFTKQDHWERLDNLLWNGRHREARRMLRRVSGDRRALANARIKLRRRRGGVDGAIARVPAELQRDPGLMYERLRWRRRKGRDLEAFEILKDPPDTMVRPELWSRERIILARRLLADGLADNAYRAIRDHGVAPHDAEAFAEAEWLAGWIALRFMKRGEEARDRFENLYRAVQFPVSKARAAYWSGRAAQFLGNTGQAGDWYQTAARYPTTYHGQLATQALGQSVHPSPVPQQPTGAERKQFESHELTHAIRLLKALDQRRHLRTFVLRHSKLGITPGHRLLSGELAHAIDRMDLAVWIARYAHLDGEVMLDMGYPLFEMPDGNPERALLMSVARQESNFYSRAISRTGARGIMQLMPRTARLVARSNGLRYSRSRLTKDPKYNIRLGRQYLEDMLAKFNGSYVLAVAAYNAGPNAVSRWLKTNGDPRNGSDDPIDWIELIPYQETRTYVQRVLGNLQVYRNRLQPGRMAVTLDNDLRRSIPVSGERTF